MIFSTQLRERSIMKSVIGQMLDLKVKKKMKMKIIINKLTMIV